MGIRSLRLLMLLCIGLSVQLAFAQEKVKTELVKALRLPEKLAGNRIFEICISDVGAAKNDSLALLNTRLITQTVLSSQLHNKKAIVYEVEAHCAKRLLHLQQAKKYIQLALKESTVPGNQLRRLLILLAYVETDLENYPAAIENYGMVEGMFRKTNNIFMLVRNYISMADLYTKLGLYRESINSLQKAKQEAGRKPGLEMPAMFYENMAINYFYLKQIDSLEYCRAKIEAYPNKRSVDSIGLRRIHFMSLMLKKDPAALREIKTVINHQEDTDKVMTRYYLAMAYKEFNQTDSAKGVIFKMLANADVAKSTYLSGKLYQLLGKVYDQEDDPKSAASYYKKSMELLELNVKKQLASDNSLAALKYYDFKNKFAVAEQSLRSRNNSILLLGIVAIMIIVILFLLYRSIKIRKRYNDLMFNQLNDELSALNSHEVRRYLCNILGIISVIKLSDDRKDAYVELEDALLSSAESLDTSIKTIATKLTDQTKLYS